LALFLSVVRLLGVRTSSATLGFGLLAASLGVLGAGSSGPAATRYEVIAPLQLATGGKVFACYAFLMTYPAEGCGGIEVRGVDFSQMPNVEAYPSGAQVSQAMRLVGTWDGHALTVTEGPQPAAKASGLLQPCVQDQGSLPGSDSMGLQLQVTDALRTRGIEVLMSTGCDSTTIGVVVPVADDATVSWLTHHYRVKVAGWLRPLPSGP
jgi:hypothetical protein